MIKYHSLSAPIGRFSIALIFIISGIMKIPAYDGTQAYMDVMGVPGFLLPLTILFEVIVAIMIVIGWKTRLSALALAGFSIITAVLFHADFGDQTHFIMFMKNIAIAGGFLFLIAHGAGAYSLDNYMKNKAQLL